jgi:hypothetical protein
MEDDFYFEENSPTKAKIITVVIIAVVVIFFGLFLVYRNKMTFNIKKVVTYEAGDTLNTDPLYYVNNKVISSKHYKVSFSSILTSSDTLDTLGEYEYKVTYKGITKKGKIKVVDTSAPKVELTKVIIGTDETLYPEDAITSCDDYSLPCEVKLAKESDNNKLSTAGTYQIPVVVSDNLGNSTTVTIEVETRENYNSIEVKENDLEEDHISVDYMDWNGEYLVKFAKGVPDNYLDEADEYDDILEASSGDLHRYIDSIYSNNGITKVEMVKIYNQYDYIIGVTFYLELDNGSGFYLSK